LLRSCLLLLHALLIIAAGASLLKIVCGPAEIVHLTTISSYTGLLQRVSHRDDYAAAEAQCGFTASVFRGEGEAPRLLSADSRHFYASAMDFHRRPFETMFDEICFRTRSAGELGVFRNLVRSA